MGTEVTLLLVGVLERLN